MICKDIIVSEGKAFCLGQDDVIYTCKTCNEKNKECQNCLPIPKPKKQAVVPHGYTEPYEGSIMDMVKKKEFLFGVGAGLLLGMLLFNR